MLFLYICLNFFSQNSKLWPKFTTVSLFCLCLMPLWLLHLGECPHLGHIQDSAICVYWSFILCPLMYAHSLWTHVSQWSHWTALKPFNTTELKRPQSGLHSTQYLPCLISRSDQFKFLVFEFTTSCMEVFPSVFTLYSRIRLRRLANTETWSQDLILCLLQEPLVLQSLFHLKDWNNLHLWNFCTFPVSILLSNNKKSNSQVIIAYLAFSIWVSWFLRRLHLPENQT